MFVDQLLQNGNNRIAAAHATWNCNGDESARTLANRALQNESVAHLVEQYYGQDPERVQFTRDQALDFLAKKARNSKDDKLSLDYLKVIVAINGWAVKAQDQAPQTKHDDSQEEFTLD
jgi:hypothetical protein